MKLDLTNMSALELDVLDQNLSAKLDVKLRNMRYDDDLELLYEQLEAIREEKERRG